MLQSRGSQRVGHELVTGQQQQPTRNIICPSSMPTVLTASPSHKLCSPFGQLSQAVRRCQPAALLCPCYLCPLFLLNSLLSAILCVWKFSSNPRADCHKFQPLVCLHSLPQTPLERMAGATEVCSSLALCTQRAGYLCGVTHILSPQEDKQVSKS